MADYSSLTDKELLCNDPPDSGKVAELISRYMKTVFACAKRYSDAADYEELVSDGMEGLLAAVRGYDAEKGEFAAFAAVCVENRLRNTAKRALKRAALLDDPENLERIADPAPTPEEAFIAREHSEEVMERIRTQLTELEEQCIRGVIMGLSYDEIARRFGIEKRRLTTLFRARAKLRRYYDRD